MNSVDPQFGALGDIHGDFRALDAVMARHPAIPFWVSAGDIADDNGQYRSPRAPLYFVKGNNEDFDVLADLLCGRRKMENLFPLANATLATVGAIRVAALGGTFAPTWYESAPRELPRRGDKGPDGRPVRDDKRRHFVRAEIEACQAMERVDVLLTHEAPRPFILEGRGGRFDAGRPQITAVLAAMRPRLHLFGHHHRLTEAVCEGVRSVGLDLVSRSYLLVNARTLEYEVIRVARTEE
ncbi:MAG: metallophosphoesterase [Vicinamibacterales bacterium]